MAALEAVVTNQLAGAVAYTELNFLAHYCVDRHINDPGFTLGKVLPDLLRNCDRSLKVRGALEVFDPAAQAVMRGIDVHLAADRRFHLSSLFAESTGRMAALFRTEGLPTVGLRPSFLSHILVELVLDRLIIIALPQYAETFYHHLSKVQDGTITQVLQCYGYGAHDRDFRRFLERFTEARYLYHYTDDSRLIFALDRIRQRVGLQPFSKAQKQWMESHAQDFERAIGETGLGVIDRIDELMS